MMNTSDWQALATRYRHERNALKRKCDHLKRRQKWDRKRIGELKTLLSKHGIDWRNDDDT